jgi:hypothetical protein
VPVPALLSPVLLAHREQHLPRPDPTRLAVRLLSTRALPEFDHCLSEGFDPPQMSQCPASAHIRRTIINAGPGWYRGTAFDGHYLFVNRQETGVDLPVADRRLLGRLCP